MGKPRRMQLANITAEMRRTLNDLSQMASDTHRLQQLLKTKTPVRCALRFVVDLDAALIVNDATIKWRNLRHLQV